MNLCTHTHTVSPLLSKISRSSFSRQSNSVLDFWFDKLNLPPLVFLYRRTKSTKAKLRDKTWEQSFSGQPEKGKCPTGGEQQFCRRSQLLPNLLPSCKRSKTNANVNQALRKCKKWAQLQDYKTQETLNGLQRLSPACYCWAQIHTGWKFSPADDLLVVCLE